MNSHSPRQERVLRIFTPVRCLNRDQLRRYHLGQMTGVEHHLVEQHLVECDLCHDALATVENPANIESYQQLSTQLSQYIHREYAAGVQPVARAQKQPVLKPQPHARRSFAESAQSYFWTVVFLAFGGGSIFLLQQHLKNRPPLSSLPLRAADAIVLPAPQGAALGDYQPVTTDTQQEVKPLVIQTKYSTRDTSHMSAAALPVAVKDTAQKKKPVKDSALPKPPVTDSNARALIANATPPPAQKETPKEPAKEEQKETPKEKAPEPARAEAEKDDPPAAEKKETTRPVNGDDYVYRSAMQYQQQGDYNEAINQYRKLSDRGRYAERARYQMAICYRAKGQKGKARRILKDIANSEGSMKSLAQAELSTMN